VGTEIERKFLVADDGWRSAAGPGTSFAQGYLSTDKSRTVRVRIAGDQAFLTIKGAPQGLARPEFEYVIPITDARQLLDELCLRPLIEKVRYHVAYGGLTWEVDEFGGDNRGLILAEVELDHPEQPVALPPWVGTEVSGDPRYTNARLVHRPFSRW
jgi:adenylate cyclase